MWGFGGLGFWGFGGLGVWGFGGLGLKGLKGLKGLWVLLVPAGNMTGVPVSRHGCLVKGALRAGVECRNYPPEF